MSLKDFLRDTLELGRDDVYKVDVKEGFSFFNTDAEHTDKVMETFNQIHLEGRKINVEISKNDSGRNNSSRRDHNGRGRSGGGGGSFGRRESSDKPAFSRESRSERPARRSDSSDSKPANKAFEAAKSRRTRKS
jgi:ATP-dependent RNA helicase DeaD